MDVPAAARIEHVVTASDGRRIRVVEGGHPDGMPVLFHHGTPGAGEPYRRHVHDAIEKGIRLIGYDRPGYGGSSRHAGYAIADSARDVAAIAKALGIDRLAVWGVSGGGPHALACAALLPGLVAAVATLASPAPHGVDGLDYFAGMGPENEEEIKLMLADEAAAFARLPRDRDAMLAMTPRAVLEGRPGEAPDVDAAARDEEFAEWLVGTFHAGLAPGAEGWWDDGMASVRPWGFAVESIRIPVQLWHGSHDRFVPFGHGRWLAAHIATADAHLTEVDGHATLVQSRIPEVHAWLLERL